MSTFNLVRNSRVFFTTNVDANTGVIPTSGSTITSSNTFEIQVLDGFSFSQATNADTITLSEAGNIPVRGQRSFNTSLGNVEFSFSTYVRPANTGGVITAEESVLWNALFTSAAISATPVATYAGTTITASYAPSTGILALSGTAHTYSGLVLGGTYALTGAIGVGANEFNTTVKVLTLSPTSSTFQYLSAPTSAAGPDGFDTDIKFWNSAWTSNLADATDTAVPVAFSQLTSALSDRNQLQKFGMYFVVDSTMYAIDNCAMDGATIDFGLDGIATIAWTGKATTLRALPNTAVVSPANPGVFSGAGNATGTAAAKNTAANYITNKLSTVKLKSNIGGVDGTTYTLALTGGSLSIANNITYITPANLGIVNNAIGYFTGTRAVSGSINAYLRTGSSLVPNSTAKLLQDMLAASTTTVDPKYLLQIEVGGSNNATRVELLMDAAMLQIPTIDAQAVMSTTINFTAQASAYVRTATSQYDIENTNELRVRYFAPAA